MGDFSDNPGDLSSGVASPGTQGTDGSEPVPEASEPVSGAGALPLRSAEEACEPISSGVTEVISGEVLPDSAKQDLSAALQHSEAVFQSLFEIPGAMRGLVQVLGDDILYLRANRASAEFFGLSRSAMRNRRATEIGVPKKTVRAWMAYCEESRRINQPVTFDYARSTSNGDQWLRATVSTVGVPPEGLSWDVCFCYEMRDITEIRETEEALKRGGAERAAALKRERRSVVEERARFAREMHDTLAQGLAGVVIQLEAAMHALPDKPETAEAHVARACQLARESLGGARRSVWALRPHGMEEGNLSSALSQIVDQLAPGSPTQISFATEGQGYELSGETEDNLLRIGQEAMTNALKHARPSQIRVVLDYDDERVRLRVEDDGQGFDPSVTDQGDGLGLRGMRERVARIGGRLTVDSQPGEGTRVVVEVPAPEA